MAAERWKGPMRERATRASPFGEDQDHALWLKYLDVAGDSAMSVRLGAMRKVVRAGRAVVARADGTTTTAPLMVAAEARAAALNGVDEQRWREDWVRHLVQLAVAWQEEASTEGIVRVLTLTDRIAEDLKTVGAWPWSAEQDGRARPLRVAGLPLTYVAEDVPASGVQAVQGADYVVWHRLLEMSGDGPVATRLAAIHAASQSNCRMTVATADGRQLCFPMMIVSEGALAAQEGKSEARWREEWTRNCVRVVSRWPDSQTADAAATLLGCTRSVIEDLKYARVWPWLSAGRSTRGSSRQGKAGQPPSA
jgi:hypothetical protein